jgi:hypothetical protein
MDWLDKFISSFAAETYQYRDQKDVYRDTQQGTTGVNQEKVNPSSKQDDGQMQKIEREDGVDETTGEEFTVEVHKYSLKPKDPKDKQERDWVAQEAMVTITSLDDEARSIHSNLSDLCNGRYANLIELSSSDIAKKLVTCHKEIFGHIEASMANYSNVINADSAMRLVQAATSLGAINFNDYNSIRNKVESGQVENFDRLITKANIQFSGRTSNTDYYMDYIRDLKEYKTANMQELKPRIANILGAMRPELRNELIKKLSQDSILSKLTR